MRTLIKLSIAGAIALAAVACNKKDVVQAGPNYNPETKEVTTQFVLSVNTGGPQTKQTAQNVQQDNNFLGIQDAHVLAYKTGMTGEAFVADPTKEAIRDYSLGNLYSSGSINRPNNAASSSNRIVELSVPVDVDAMLFYGRATRGTTASAAANGQLTFNIASKPEDTHFDLEKRLDESNFSYTHTSALMAFVINRIISSEVPAMTTGEVFTATGDPKTPKTNYSMLPALKWSDLGALYSNAATRATMAPLEEVLGNAYATFTKIETGEYRAGASAAVQNMMASLIDVALSVQNADPTGDAEANASRLANEIISRKNRYFTTTMAYQSVADIRSTVISLSIDGINNETAWNARFEKAADLNDYPRGTFKIPDGAAQMTFDPVTGMFSYLNDNKPLVNPGATFDPNHYLYPAELAYYVNSPLRVTKKDVASADYPNGVTPWDTDGSWTTDEWVNNSKVQSDTRSIAVRNNINYGVALLESKVAIKSGISYLNDNKSAKTGDATDNQIPVSDPKIVLQGILVGGQTNTVDWEFLPKISAGNEFSYVIYDDEVPTTSSAIPTSGSVYTLVLDNYNRTLGATQSSVRVALEFKNEGDPFWGRDNIIPKGGVFYLVGVLEASATGTGVTSAPVWPNASQYAIPPIYGVDGNTVEASPAGTVGYSKQINRVFIQNFVTSATFTLDENSLKHAYVSIPNLASTQMSLGLSVDLKWHSGFTYNVTL